LPVIINPKNNIRKHIQGFVTFLFISRIKEEKNIKDPIKINAWALLLWVGQDMILIKLTRKMDMELQLLLNNKAQCKDVVLV
jgi:hypothetical protein